MPKQPTKLTTMRFPEDFYARLREHAEADNNNSMTELVVRVVNSWMNQKRYDPYGWPLTEAAKARQAAADAPYKRPRGRPMARAEGARQDWLVAIINRDFPRDSEQSLDAIVHHIAPDGGAVNFPVAVERNLVLAGWQQAIRTSDDATVWLGPEHPARP